MTKPLNVPERILMGPGPSNVPHSVLAAMAQPTLGHLDPVFLEIMNEISAMLRTIFVTKNALTMPMSGTGSAGMETCLVNLLEPGDRAIIGVHGVFGARMVEMARRCGAEVITVEAEWGKALDPNEFRKHGEAKLIAVVHAETSTGVLQDLAPFRAIADELGALFVVDAVASLGGVPLDVDGLGIDAVYSGSQKCLSGPPGVAPVSFSQRALDAMAARKTPVRSWYLDVSLIAQYWGGDRVYHHTAPINTLYGLHEACRLVCVEGLDARIARHRAMSDRLRTGLLELGLNIAGDESTRLHPVTLVLLAEGIDDLKIRRALLNEYGLEIGGGLGAFKGKAWRIGLMGASATPKHVDVCLAALRRMLP